jgi:hypothetical protein
MDFKLDKYEQEIEDNIDNFIPLDEDEKKQIKAIIDQINKEKNIALLAKKDRQSYQYTSSNQQISLEI